MPYELRKTGNRYCVFNQKTGENKGCSKTRARALGHMRLLYAVEGGAKLRNKELEMTVEGTDVDLDSLEEAEEKELAEKGYVPYGVSSFEQLDQYRQSQEMAFKTYALSDDLMGLIQSAVSNPDIEDKATAIKSLAEEYATRVGSIAEDETPEEKAKRSDVSEADKKRAVAEYGKVTYADPTNKKYPIDSEKHIRAAWSYINMPRNASKYPDKGKAIKSRIIAAWKRVIDKAGPPEASAKKDASYLQDFFDALESTFYEMTLMNKEVEGEDEELPEEEAEEKEAGEFLVYKEEDGSLKWLGRYSNNFRDDDHPAEIISEKSHKRFVEFVDKELYPLPVLQIWHRPEWQFAKADWVAYDETGFSIAGGTVDKGCEDVAEWVSQQKGVKMSHGMPNSSIKRDPEDPSVIIEHQTAEISVLPDYAAANKYTGFVVLGEDLKEGSDMAIPKAKVEALIRDWHADPELLHRLEARNEQDAKKALEEGRDTKETTTDQVEQETQEVATEEAVAEEPPKYATIDEIADAFAVVMKPHIEKLGELENTVTALAGEVKSLKQSDDEKTKETVMSTPAASMAAILAQRFSAIGSSETQVDGRTSLAQQKPKETAAGGSIGIRVLDRLVETGKVEL